MATVADEPKEAAERFVPLPRRLTDSQLDSIRALPAHDRAPTPTTEASRPAEVYTDPTRFAAEMAHIFRKVAVPITPSCRLPEPGTLFADDSFGVPVLLTRDRAGKVRAFYNICLHRGSKVVDGCDPVKAGRVSCPYHAWTYGLDGQLVGIPRAETFPSADKAALGLMPMPVHETAGYIWVGLEKGREAPLPPGTDRLDADLCALGLREMHVYGQRHYDLASNWKLVVEPFLEAYHVQRLHAKTVAGLNADVNPVMVWLGEHLRQTAGKIQFVPGEEELNSDRLHRTITHSYFVFPNTIIVTSPYFISSMILMPRAVDRTIVQYTMLMPQPIRSERGEDLFRRSYAFQDEIFSEDFGAGVMQQQALSCGALETVRYGGMEAPIGPFHDLVERYLP
ncbi:aromatic ring-hydroxylating dioxygenase subunit alpha [Sphingomonas sp. CGMCC 1.13654]|uniref:Aromatic ring-hydroxylating dioxygenase subunit alpha n=1 Tax=Sphingomonas chungangi TaxID=2683589 RepID=A0A838L3T1_9SPHN|nr:aromatic ring-hydroxylating dioxygenase subunit alpha [Sphingomonas chungangi]MBA2933834.1 aromatic ring-hydroxylating dioxygenase subunit alpha [Sphingomonas chungangi]